MIGILNGNIGSVTDIKIPAAKEGKPAQYPFFVISASDVNAGKNAPDEAKWVTVFVRAETVEKLQKLHDVLKVGNYFTAQGQASAKLNFYQQKATGQQVLSVTPGGITLMGKPLGTGAPAEASPEAGSEPVPAGVGAAGGAADLEDDIGF
jgi:hypothetical protein